MKAKTLGDFANYSNSWCVVLSERNTSIQGSATLAPAPLRMLARDISEAQGLEWGHVFDILHCDYGVLRIGVVVGMAHCFYFLHTNR